MINNQNSACCTAIFGVIYISASWLVSLQTAFPAFIQFFSIVDLVGFGAFGCIGPGSYPLKMDHSGQRLVNHPVTHVANFECEVSVFAICREVVLVKTTKLIEQHLRYHDGCP